jgi:hypothetical protein
MADVPPEDDTVVTPGGPRPRDQVFAVHPGEALRRLPDGSYVVVPAEPENPPDTGSRKDNGAEGASEEQPGEAGHAT